MMLRLRRKVKKQFGNKDGFDERMVVRIRTTMTFGGGVMLWDRSRIKAVKDEILPLLRDKAWRFNLVEEMISWVNGARNV
jgi:hypothetical protein